MLPELAGLPLQPPLVGLGIGVGLLATVIGLRRAGLRLGWREALLLAGCVAAGLAGAKLESVIERGGAVYDLGREWRHGFRWAGGMLAVGAAAPLLWRLLGRRTPIAALADVMVPAAALAMAVVRLGCFAAGCCHGVPTALPWGIRFPQGSHPWTMHVTHGLLTAEAPASLAVHPLQLYLAVASLAVGLGGIWLWRQRRWDGQVALICLALDGAAKLGLETLRHPPLPHLQWAAAAIALAAVTVLLAVRLWQHSPTAVAAGGRL